LSDGPNFAEARAILAGVSATAAVTGQTQKQTGSMGQQAYRGRPLAAEKAGFRVREPRKLQVLWIGW
jgi:hypothetical protein